MFVALRSKWCWSRRKQILSWTRETQLHRLFLRWGAPVGPMGDGDLFPLDPVKDDVELIFSEVFHRGLGREAVGLGHRVHQA